MVTEPRRTDFTPLGEEAVALPTPELAMRLLGFLVALEEAFGGTGRQVHAPALHPETVVQAETWPEHAASYEDPFPWAIK